MDQGRVDGLAVFFVYVMIFSFVIPTIGTLVGILSGWLPWEFLIELCLPSQIVGLWETKIILTVFSAIMMYIMFTEGNND